MKTFFLSLILFFFCKQIVAQELQVVSDSIMDNYMKTGFSNTHFRPKGKTDKSGQRQGKWNDYEVVKTGSFFSIKNDPKEFLGTYLLYGEGAFVNGKRDGKWNLYIIEDKTFRKILSQKLAYVDGRPEGEFKFFYPDGNIAKTGNYKNGQIEGAATIYYQNGAVFGLQTYTEGKKEGLQKYYFPTGKKKSMVNYVAGKMNGKSETYYENGNIQESMEYTADSADGNYRYYYSSGQLWTEKTYKDGMLMNVKAVYDKNGKELDKGNLENGNGFVNFYTEEGKIYSKETFQNGRKIKEETFGEFH
ncbi:MAG: toxin-antitoxin system YwqK family antitoxin [Flavisolibacter sp.]